jgi:S-adenosylmethionine:tRNA-ribosyltransferase-isomerase (queuine synthetase)
MPSGGRPFTERIVDTLRTRGIDLVGILLHAGVSSLKNAGTATRHFRRSEEGESPYFFLNAVLKCEGCV